MVQIVKPSFEIMTPIDGMQILKVIEAAGRTCYRSEDCITETSALAFCKRILEPSRKHESVIEHFSVTVRIVCDRGVSHEIVRHRLASYSQESTRYVNYSKGKFGNQITVIAPLFWSTDSIQYNRWLDSVEMAEKTYMELLELGATPQEARSVLPNSLKTEIVVTMNLRSWRNFFQLRTAKTAHPQMIEIARPMLAKFRELIPVIFDDVGVVSEET
jgi:thymidylate synthase (FAD)